MLRACTKLTSVARRLTCGECAEHISPTSRVALHLLLTTAAAGRAADGYRRGRCSSDHNGESGGKYRENAWYYSSASESATPSSMTAALIAAVLAGMGVFSTGSIVLQEQGPVPGGPILEGDEDDAFQRFPASSRVHHAIKLARQNTARERRRYYQYVIVGAGTTAKAAIEAILAVDPAADILMLTDEVCLPGGDVYRKDRPLPQDLLGAYNEWRRHVSARLDNEPKAFSSVPMTLLLGRERLRLDPQKRSLVLDDGTEVFFDKCLLATAGKPRQFYVLDYEKSAYLLRGRVNTLGSLADFESLDIVRPSLRCEDVSVVGGGFLGTEVALAMANRGMKVRQVYAEAAPLCRQLPMYLAEYVKQKLERHGVEPVAERLVTDVRSGEDNDDMDMDKITMYMMGLSKEYVTTDYIVMASTHVDPVVDVARDSGLEIDPVNGGVVVNGQLEAVSGIYAAGACASYYDQALGRRRADILEHGVRSGWLAGYNMAVTSLASKHAQDPRRVLLDEYHPDTGSSASDEGLGNQGALERSTTLAEGQTSPLVGGAGGSWSGLQHPRIYREQPAFKSRLHNLDITVDGVGEIDSRTRTVGIWVEGTDGRAAAAARKGGDGASSGEHAQDKEEKEASAAVAMISRRRMDGVIHGMPHEFNRGIVYYLHGSQVIGIVLWNASDMVDKARDVINNQPAISSVEELKTLIALAPDDWLRVVETSPMAPPMKRQRARS